MNTVRWLSIAGALSLLSACTGNADQRASADETLSIFSTTGYIGDVVANVAPLAENIVWVGPGGDPHTQQASTKDVQRIMDADVVFWNGLHLEAQIEDQLYTLGERQLAVAEQLPKDMLLPWLEGADIEGDDTQAGAAEAIYDPHVWNDPHAWAQVTLEIAAKLAEVDPANADEYHANAAAYTEQIELTHRQVSELLDTIPAHNRTLITGHDAFNYFGNTYGLTVYATDFVSSDATMSSAELSGLVDLIITENVPTIFVDNLKNDQAIVGIQEAVQQRGGLVQVAEAELFADSLGAQAPVDTYLGALLHNAQTVADGLGE